MHIIYIIPNSYLSKEHVQTHVALERQQLALLWIHQQLARGSPFEHLRTLGWIEKLLNLVLINGHGGMQ